ncbi:MAG: rfbC [Frankiales bacterium]|nr:rfbC [Frankiales bacterium]
MQIAPTSLAGVVVVSPAPRVDERGFFVRIMDAAIWRDAGLDVTTFVQENQSRSAAGTLRGIHVTAAPGETKVVRCARGRLWDVVVDLRPSSATFRQWESFVLDDVDHRQVVIPPGCGHAFLAQTDADACYRHSAFYEPGRDTAIAWDDPDIGIRWPLTAPPLLSERDRTARSFADALPDLTAWFVRPA